MKTKRKTFIIIVAVLSAGFISTYLYTRLGGMNSDIIEVTFNLSGGVDGRYYEVSIFEENGKYFLTETDDWQSDKELYEISQSEYHNAVLEIEKLGLNHINGYHKYRMANDGIRTSFLLRYSNHFVVKGQEDSAGYPSTHNAKEIQNIIEDCITDRQHVIIPIITDEMLPYAESAAISLRADIEITGRDIAYTWANAVTERNGDKLVSLCNEETIKSLVDRGWIDVGKNRVTFGFSEPWPSQEYLSRLVFADDEERCAEFMYYAVSSEPHVTVWVEQLSYTLGSECDVIGESMRIYSDIESYEDFASAYRYTLRASFMNYEINGFGEELNRNALQDSNGLGKKLFGPESAARYLLNLSEDESKVVIELLETETKEEIRTLLIKFVDSGDAVFLTMFQPWGASGIWIPDEYATVPPEDCTLETDIEFDMREVINGQDNNNRDDD